MATNFEMPVTGAPSRGLPSTAGSFAASSAASLASDAGEYASPSRSLICPDRSRSWPDLSISPGFSWPIAPYRTSFILDHSLDTFVCLFGCLACFMEQGAAEFNCPAAQGCSDNKSESLGLAPDMAGAEMAADHQRRRVG